MKNFLLDIVEQLYDRNIQGSAMVNGRRMLSAVIIACCLHEMIPGCIRLSDIHHQHLRLLLSLFYLMPNVQDQKCDDWDYLIALIPTSFRKAASESVLALTVHLSHVKYFDLPDWLFAIPVIHFLRVCNPFHKFELNPRRIPWGDKLIGLQSIRSKTHNDKTR